MFTSEDVTLLQAAYSEGLLPDPQRQTSMICAVLANLHREADSKAYSPDDFLIRNR